MSDRESVTNGLEWVLCDIEGNGHYQIEYYAGEIRKAIALLKDQEPVEPKPDTLSQGGWDCGKCGKWISRFHDYCPYCGREIKWNA